MQIVAAVAMNPPANASPDSQKDAKQSLFESVLSIDPAHCVRGQYDGYLNVDGVAEGSDTETYVAMRLLMDNWQWEGVPFYLRTGKRLPERNTEVRLIFRHPPRLPFLSRSSSRRRPSPDQLVIRIDPGTGIRLSLDARRADRAGASEIDLDMDFASEGGEGATPLRGAPGSRPGRRLESLHPAGRGGGVLANRGARARQPAQGDRLPPGLLGARGGRRHHLGHTAWQSPWMPSTG